MSRIIFVSEHRMHDETLLGWLEEIGVEVESCTFMELPARLPLTGAECVVAAVGGELDRVGGVLKEIREIDDNLSVIVIGESHNVDDVVRIMKEGAFDFFHPPLQEERFKHAVLHAAKLYNLTRRIFFLENQVGWQGKFAGIIGHSARMQEIFRMISTVARSDATVLITGESGTGKELVAKAVHQHSLRVRGRFIDLNCGAIPRELLENELFGHEKGAFTGADRRYMGCCERAHKGTLFLDEICEMEPALQVKILRLLQEKTCTRVGGTEQIAVDVRFVAATNRRILDEVKQGRFREDLYYRLNVVPIEMPPLRERKEDVPLLASHFLQKFAEKNEKIFVDFAPEAMELLVNYDWPGNVRELENTIERTVVLNNDSRLKAAHLPTHLQHVKRKIDLGKLPMMRGMDMAGIMPLELVEKYAIEAALRKCEGNVGEAARKLKIGQATMYRKIRQYGLKSTRS